jgi:hypothetical protein
MDLKCPKMMMLLKVVEVAVVVAFELMTMMWQ